MRNPSKRRACVLPGVILALGAQGCATPREDGVSDANRDAPRTPHEAYAAALEDAGLAGSSIVETWRTAAAEALGTATRIDPPFREIAFYPGEEPTASAYEVSVERGQAIQASLDLEPASDARVFLDIYRREPDGSLEPMASASDSTTAIEFEPLRAGTFVIRVQPEVLRTVRVTLTVLRAATLAFPVQGRGRPDIGSRFGAPRDGGRRSHHGVDIFAARGTPVVAVADGRVSRVEETRLGGRVVWLRDETRRHSYYYAHLDRQLVERGQRVRAGDTLGLVGNTGNARTTPPHLHFGIYARREGPVDPFAFVVRPPTRPPGVVADSSALGEWLRLRVASVVLDGTDARSELPRHTVARVLAAHGRRHRLQLPDGRRVEVADARFERMDEPIGDLVLDAARPLLHSPAMGALATGEIDGSSELPVVGRFGDYRLVRPSSGASGWVAAGF
ncbi:MAG: M23 family metallopeptidase [Gemmatimonadetes bacterium]|nr:M23 family metallopeptidase [Gemmatimonadota bacterium]